MCYLGPGGITRHGMLRRPGDGDVIIPFDLVKEDINLCDETLVGHGFDGAGGKELYKMVALSETRL